jgi:hypothetical protein
MKRLALLVTALTVLIIPAAASARTPVSGGLKQTITRAAMRAESRGSYQTQQTTDAVRSCTAPPYGHGMGNDPGAPMGDISARNMRCQNAVRAIQRGRLTAQGFFTFGFVCHTLSTAKYGGGTIRCTHAVEAFRFTWGT